jgi:Intracellular proteinase inhibitor
VLKFSIALFVLAAVVRAACVSDPGGTIEECRTFSTSLSVEDRMSQAEKLFNPHEPITFELLIANALNAPATLTAGSSCTAVVFEVTDSAGRRQWGSADNLACIQMLQPRTYAGLESVTEAATWDQRDSDGALVTPGSYAVTAAAGQYVSNAGGLLDCRTELSKSATFTIR